MLAARAPVDHCPSGIPALGEVPWGAHLCHFFRTPEDLESILVPFFRAGLHANEQCLWITAPPFPAEEARAALRAAVPNYDTLEARGQIEILGHDEWYLRNDGLDPDEVVEAWLAREQEARRNGYRGLRLSGSTYWLERKDWEGFIDYEARVHVAFHGRRILALCSYSLERCDSVDLLDVLRHHGSALVRHDGQWELIQSGTALLAEVDRQHRAIHRSADDAAADVVAPAHAAPTIVGSAPDAPRSVASLVSSEFGDEHADHDVCFYDEERFPAASIGEYLAEALRAGGCAIAVVAPQHETSLRSALSEEGIDVGTLMARRQLIILDARASLELLRDGVETPGGARALRRASFDNVIAQRVREASAAFPRVHVFGEMVDLLCREDQASSAEVLEGWWNELHAQTRFRLLCAYRLASFEAVTALDSFANICRAHGAVSTLSGSLRASRIMGPPTASPSGSPSDSQASPASAASAPSGGTLVGGLDPGRLLAHFEQRSRALESEVSRVRRLEQERRRLLEVGREASTEADGARTHLARLQTVTSALLEAATIADVCRVVRTQVVDAAGASAACIAVLDEASGKLLALGADGNFPGPSTTGACPEPGSPLELAFRTGSPSWPTTSSDTVALPLAAGARRYGAVSFVLGSARALSTADRALLEDLARQLALAFDRAHMLALAQQAQARAEEANRVKDEFLAMLGHELRNPLAPMKTALEMMRLGAGDVARAEREVIERQLQHMTRLVDDLLDVSRITRGAVELSRHAVELSELVARGIEIASPALETRAHRLSTEVPPRVVLEVDPNRIAQVIGNLLTNAAKYTPPGGTIDVTAKVVGDRVRLTVRDDGIGIDASLLPRIFELFVQGPQDLDRAAGGLGLGLAIVRRLVELHGGSVSAASEGFNRGSAFTIELPVAATARSTAARSTDASERIPLARAPEPSTAGSLRVLVVDDNRDAAEMFALLLEAGGHVARTAHDGPAALALLESFQPDLALLDIGLPVMDGYELARQLRARLREATPILVAVTGYGQAEDRTRTRNAGFDEHFVKPVEFSQLEGVIHRVLASKAAASARCA